MMSPHASARSRNTCWVDGVGARDSRHLLVFRKVDVRLPGKPYTLHPTPTGLARATPGTWCRDRILRFRDRILRLIDFCITKALS